MVRAKIVKAPGKKARITYSKETKKFVRVFKSIIPTRFYHIFTEPVVVNLIGEDEMYQKGKLKEIKNILIEKEQIRMLNKQLENMALKSFEKMNMKNLNLNLSKLSINSKLKPLIPVFVERM